MKKNNEITVLLWFSIYMISHHILLKYNLVSSRMWYIVNQGHVTTSGYSNIIISFKRHCIKINRSISPNRPALLVSVTLLTPSMP